MQGFLGVHIDLHIFMELQRMGRFVFLLDGLDEMASKVDRVVISENLRELDRLSASGDNVFVVTCRTHFFQEKITDEFLQNYHVIYLKEWDLEDLTKYLKKRCGSDWRTHYDRIIKWPQLVDLSRTPLLVEMLVSSLNDFSDSQPLNLGLLYQTYTGRWINRESQRRGAIMSSQQRHRFARQLAATLYAHAAKAVHYSSLYEIARDFSGYADAAKLDYFDTDIRTCTFITRDSQGNYSFRHRSFLEYFSALAIADEIRSGSAGLLSLRQVSPEVMSFLEIAALDEGSFGTLADWSKRGDQELLSQNAASILIRFNRTLDAEVERRLGLEPAPAESVSEATILEEFTTENYEAIRKTVAKAAGRSMAPSDVEDLTQVVLMRLLGNPERIRENQMGIRNLMGYIYTVAKYAALDRYRVSARHGGGEGLDSESLRVVDPKGLDFVADVEVEELNQALAEILDSHALTARARDVFRRRLIDGASYEDISKGVRPSAFDTSFNTVPSAQGRSTGTREAWIQSALMRLAGRVGS